MPVGTQGAIKGLTPQQVSQELGAQILLANTYHLYLRPGHELIERLGGLHRFMAWPGAILTDSGGYQVFSLSSLRKVTEEGVIFRSHIDGARHLFTPESTVDVQLALGSDIAMVLDECLPYPCEYRLAQESMQRTVRWAYAAMKHFNDSMASRATPAALFPIVQGSMYADLRRRCAEQLLALDADGYAVGGLSVGEPRELSLQMAEASLELLPGDRPRYVMGVGTPEELSEYVARGVDMMDCVLPTRNARNGYLFTSQGPLIIKQARYREDAQPVDSRCCCYTCRTFTRAYLRHLFQAGEMLYSMLATLHNLHFYLTLMRRIRRAILEGRFSALRYELSQGSVLSTEAV
jgi:queuine tRNA-ribosyltransferase